MLSKEYLKEVARKYEIELVLVLDCLKESLEKMGKYGKLYVDMKKDKLYFYQIIYNRFGEKRKIEAKIKQDTYQGILDYFLDKITEESLRQKKKILLTPIKKDDGVIEGQVSKILKNGFEVQTAYGYGFCPNTNVFIKDLRTNKIRLGDKTFFHIKKYRLKGKNALLLDKKHINIFNREASEIMGDCGIFHIERHIGKKAVIYCSKYPSKEQIKTLAKTANLKIEIELRS